MHRRVAETSDPDRIALLGEGIDKLQAAFNQQVKGTGKKATQWNDLYLATIDPNHDAELVFVAAAGDQFMAQSNSDILFGRLADLPEPLPTRRETFRLGGRK